MDQPPQADGGGPPDAADDDPMTGASTASSSSSGAVDGVRAVAGVAPLAGSSSVPAMPFWSPAASSSRAGAAAAGAPAVSPLAAPGGSASQPPVAAAPPPAAHQMIAGRQRPKRPPMIAGATALRIRLPSTDEKVEVFSEKYQILQKIGEGANSSVCVCTELATGQQYALKIVDLRPLRLSRAYSHDKLLREVEIMRSLPRHQNLIALYDFYETSDKLMIVEELVRGGELFTHILERGMYTEEEARPLMKQIIIALKVLHDHKIVHRDVKPENILLQFTGLMSPRPKRQRTADDPPDEVPIAKLADFGLAKMLGGAHSVAHTMVGTPQYFAPEILWAAKDHSLVYGIEADCWSAGVVLYLMLCGRYPFDAEHATESREKRIVTGNFTFDEKWADISNAAKHLVASLLTVDPKKRMSMTDALEHPWFTGIGAEDLPLVAAQPSYTPLVRAAPRPPVDPPPLPVMESPVAAPPARSQSGASDSIASSRVSSFESTAASAMAFTIDGSGYLSKASEEFLEALDLSEELAVGQPFHHLVAPESRVRFQTQILPAVTLVTGSAKDIPMRMLKRDGSAVSVLLGLVAVRTDMGELSGITGTIARVTTSVGASPSVHVHTPGSATDVSMDPSSPDSTIDTVAFARMASLNDNTSPAACLITPPPVRQASFRSTGKPAMRGTLQVDPLPELSASPSNDTAMASMPAGAMLEPASPPSLSYGSLRARLLSLSTDVQGNINSVNDAWLEVFRWQRKDVIGQSFVSLLAPSARTHATTELLPRLLEYGRIDAKLRVLSSTGTEIPVTLASTVERDHAGNAARIVHVLTLRAPTAAAAAGGPDQSPAITGGPPSPKGSKRSRAFTQ